jgi:hypothetical protein
MRSLVFLLFALAALTLALSPSSWFKGPWVPASAVPVVQFLSVLPSLHILAYGSLVVLGTWVWGRLWPVVLGVFLFSVAVEAVQTQLPWRTGALQDVVLNMWAVLLGAVVVLVFRAAVWLVSGIWRRFAGWWFAG